MIEIKDDDLNKVSDNLRKVLIKWRGYIKTLDSVPAEKLTLREKEILKLWRVTDKES